MLLKIVFSETVGSIGANALQIGLDFRRVEKIN
jgi:hypothetical protein